MRQKKIIVIGAGASGLMAAIAAAECGAGVLVLEHMDSPGKKLLLTGNGRCNFTNTDVKPQHYHSLARGRDDSFTEAVLRAFPCDACIAYFRQLGIEPETRYYRFDESGYVYPGEGGAGRVLKALLDCAASLGVRFIYQSRLRTVLPSEDGGVLAGWHYLCGGHTQYREEYFDAMILATGSNACPETGSDSSVYPVLKELGLDRGFTGFYPALCPLYSKDPLLQELKGKRRDGTAAVELPGGIVRQESGEIQFNAHSISGIPVMQLSRYFSAQLKDHKELPLRIVLPGEDPEHPALDHVFQIHRTAGFGRAQCCTGGIMTTTVDPLTMASLLCRGVYICGELLDIDGDCGGYNLHFAWATGRIAGRNAALTHDQDPAD